MSSGIIWLMGDLFLKLERRVWHARGTDNQGFGSSDHAACGARCGERDRSSADLGGNCCADLEERIAELEATTARKGNRKVSLEVYGQVNEAILWWDDGFESNAGIYTNDNSRTRIGFRGKAKINSDLEAGYRLEIGVRTQNSKRFNQNDPSANSTGTGANTSGPESALGTGGISDNGLDIRDSHWYLKSKSLGALSVGKQATATDAITEINQSQTGEVQKYSDIEDTGGGLLLRGVNGDLSNPAVAVSDRRRRRPAG